MRRSSIEPKHFALTEFFREQILSGKIQQGERLPSDEMLAKEYGINKRTVAAGLAKLVSEGLINRAPGRGSVVIRQNVIFRKNNVVGCIANSSGEVYSPMETELTTQIMRKGFYPMWVPESLYRVATSTPRHPLFFQFTERFIDDMPYGLLIHGERFMPFDMLERNRSKFDRLVFICDYLHTKKMKAKYVLIDYKAAAKKAIRYLMRNGHRKVTLLTTARLLPGMTPQECYHNAICEVCREYGMEYDAEIPDLLWKNTDPVPVFRMIRRRKITAALLAFDSVVWIYRNAMETAHLRIPEDLSVIGLYDTNSYNEPITTLNIQERKIAGYATEMLFEESRDIHEIYVEPQLIERESVRSI
ncbi:MAG: GntR family transcriptional regulator [Lentisphaeria bacterium]|nr:GntR family transcriptional regulator [Lentisphaeria bacterium]